jgi:putative two-component system response regulator
MLENEFDIMEVENGIQAVQALQEHAAEISLLLLDIVMPEMDGFEVLALMNKYHWIDDIPVIMISAENSPTYIERAYDFGVTDFINRPFEVAIVRRRVANTMLLAARQRRLMDIVTDQIYQKEKSNKLMISILSHIVEFRNGESGLHVLHINTITGMLLKKLVQKTDAYPLTQTDISLITTASALHDIGKISIPDEVLNKPGRLTAEEFTIIKRHSIIGAEMLDNLPPLQKQDALVKVAYEICRWHHERYDGKGYPDGLKGDEIPISAQVVSLADVYDALTSERCYKEAYSHDQAMRMILDGQCGVFNPLLLECLEEIGDTLKNEMKQNSPSDYESRDIQAIAEQLHNYELSSTERLLKQVECERQQFQFLSMTASEPIFRYTVTPPVLTVNECGQARIGIEGTVADPLEDQHLRSLIDHTILEELIERIRKTTPEHPMITMDIPVKTGSEKHWFRFICNTLWMEEEEEKFSSVVGRLIDVDREHFQEDENQKTQIDFQHALRTDQASGYNVLRNGKQDFTGYEAWKMIQSLQGVFEYVRLVDAGINIQVNIDEKGNITKSPYKCYCMWEKEERCENCISAKCICCKNRLSKFEYVGEDIYYVLAMYVEIDQQPYALEMINKINDETLICGFGKEELVEYISIHNKKLYIDPVSEVYNRRYYEEQIKGLRQIEAVAMIDVDEFKNINDSYGHQTGDLALKMIGSAIKNCVRKTDAVVRYGGDEFVVVFRDIPEEVFYRKLDEIRESVKKLKLSDSSEASFSISVGGVYRGGRISDMISEADERMYREKRKRVHSGENHIEMNRET